MNLSAGKEWGRRRRERTWGHSGGRRGRDEWRQHHGHTHTTCVRQTAGEKPLLHTGSPARCSVMT